MNVSLMHVAFVCDDIPGTVERLLDAGATVVSRPETTLIGDELAMLRDPWGFSIRLCKRAEAMV